ncbi:MAG: CPBP family intramembrane metalloprotease [Chlorobi bacterium]|nr:CPBP family intramembrane metalloprotease [Chlorobiota bacterium]
MLKAKNKNFLTYAILTYVIFWLLLAITGILISLKLPAYIQNIMKNICAWAPTFAVAVLFRKLYPGTTIIDYFKRNFLSKVNPLTFIAILALQLAISVIAVLSYILLNKLTIGSLSLISPAAILPTILIIITSGPMGEELGWRGYALNELLKKKNAFTSSIILGFIWGFWHLPLWLLSGYSGINLIQYIFFFLVAIVSLSIIITIIYIRSKNILIAMWIHFLFNFLLKIPDIDLLHMFTYTAGVYFIVALLLLLIYRKQFFKPIQI